MKKCFFPISVLPFPPTPVCPADWATLITSFAYLTLARLCDCGREESIDVETLSFCDGVPVKCQQQISATFVCVI